jgi:hypothetical protein
MAWHSETKSAAPGVGSLIAFLDNYLVLNAKWTIHDAAAGTNKKVYRCQDAAGAVLFYVAVDDNYAAYAGVQVWEGWDAGTHAGTGQSTTLGYIRKGTTATTWYLAVADWRFIFVTLASGQSHYVGMMNRADIAKNCPIVLLCASTSSLYNAIGNATGGNSIRKMLWDEAGNANVDTNRSYQAGACYLKTYDGTYLVQEMSMVASGRYQGSLNGAMVLHNQFGGLANGDEVTVGGVVWKFFGASTAYMGSLVRMS